MKIKDLLGIIGSRKIIGDKNTLIQDLGLPFYRGEGILTYCLNEKYLKIASENPCVTALLTDLDTINLDLKCKVVISSSNPFNDFFSIHNYLTKTEFYEYEFKSRIADNSYISPQTYIAKTNVILQEGVRIYPGAVILENTYIGRNSIVAPNSVIGFEGTQLHKTNDSSMRIQHCGGVHIGENTQVGAGSFIVKSLFRKKTYVGNNVTIGNMVNIGHNCHIDNDVSILAQSIISGSTFIKKGARISPGAKISSSIVIGERANIKIGSVVIRDVIDGEVVSGNFAISHKKNLKAYLKKLR